MVKGKPAKLAPALIAAGVIAVVCLLRIANFSLEGLERITYDMRVRLATHFPAPVATNLGCVFIGDDDIDAINNGLIDEHRYGLYWPRHVYARAYRELVTQGAQAVGFDILFDQARPDHAPVQVSASEYPDVREFLSRLHPDRAVEGFTNGTDFTLLVDSDDFLAWQLYRGGNGLLAAEKGTLPIPLLSTNARNIGDISADKDSDGVLRRAKAFRVYRRWNPHIRQEAINDGWDLDSAQIERGRILMPHEGGTNILVIDEHTNFSLADLPVVKLPPNAAPRERAFEDERVWHMGIVLAAQELKLDLTNAAIDLRHGRIALRGAGGTVRTIPVDSDGYFYVNWELTIADSRLMKESIGSLIEQDQIRIGHETGVVTNRWAGKLAIMGSVAQGNYLTDRGTTPLEKDTFLVSKHWNVANSIITGRFVRRTSLGLDLLIVCALGLATAFLTWRLRAMVASGAVVLLAGGYLAASAVVYINYRYWLPVVLPVFVVMLMEHVCLVTWRVVFEQSERRHMRSIFSRLVSPHIVNELLQLEKLELGGARKEVTVLFADVRGFTEFTDRSQEKAAAYAEEHKLSGEALEAYYNEFARETLHTVNTYLAMVADQVLKHEGLLDKYIGDCVMAFWGAPIANPKQAVACVRAAIDAQRAVYELNRSRALENRKRELENMARLAGGQAPQPLLPILMLGTGINTGMATAGLMGSEQHQVNYTVFGREVNLASRLESLSGRGRVLISEPTYLALQRDDPELAATCRALAPEKLKGFRTAVKVFEVPWRLPGTLPFDEEFMGGTTVEPASATTFVQRSSG